MSRELVEHLCDQLRAWAAVQPRRMFGGYGLFRDGRMFALVLDGRVYFKSDAGNRAAFDAVSAPPFSYPRRGKIVQLGYREPPAEALDEPEALQHWAKLGWQAACRAAAVRE